MTRDYAKKRPRSQAKSTAYKTQVPGWVWLFTGSVLGAFVMFLIYLAEIPPQPSTIPDRFSELSKPLEAPAGDSATEEDREDSPTPKPRFDFYQLLKESEVVVDPDPIPESETPRKEMEDLEYVLQVGSFKNAADADRLRAQLILYNLDTKVETVKVRNAETWHRVLVGPFSTRATMSKARDTLANNELESLLLKRSIDG